MAMSVLGILITIISLGVLLAVIAGGVYLGISLSKRRERDRDAQRPRTG